MDRNEVYESIDSERNYQEFQKQNKQSHVVRDFPMGSAISAIEYNLNKVRDMWYNTTDPHMDSMEYFRKIAAICVQMGERYGMPPRTDNPKSIDNENH